MSHFFPRNVKSGSRPSTFFPSRSTHETFHCPWRLSRSCFTASRGGSPSDARMRPRINNPLISRLLSAKSIFRRTIRISSRARSTRRRQHLPVGGRGDAVYLNEMQEETADVGLPQLFRAAPIKRRQSPTIQQVVPPRRWPKPLEDKVLAPKFRRYWT